VPEVRLSQLSKAYPPDVTAVCDLELTIADGELMVLVGPSGCGKSTTLRLIAGLERPTAGTIHFDQQDVTCLPAARRRVGMVFQGDNHFPQLNVRENLAVGLRLRRRPASVVQQRLTETTRSLNLEPLLDRWPHELSGGEGQRVALGRLLAGQMPLGLLDEPLSHVDPAQRNGLRDAVRTLHQQIQSTLIYVTHDQQEAMSLGQRIAVMHQGRILQVDTPQQIYRTPANTFVASFIGTPAMNLIAARVTHGRLIVEDRPIAENVGVPDGPLVVGIRPERLQTGLGAAAVQFQGTIQAVEFWGADQVLYLRHNDLRLAVRRAARGEDKVGELLKLGCQRQDVYLFAADASGQAWGTLTADSR
jgi:sn-glycerol 3-phosphate transport system ATP-binding protein